MRQVEKRMSKSRATVGDLRRSRVGNTMVEKTIQGNIAKAIRSKIKEQLDEEAFKVAKDLEQKKMELELM